MNAIRFFMYTQPILPFIKLLKSYSCITPFTGSYNRIGVVMVFIFSFITYGVKSQTVSINIVPVNGNFCAPSPVKLTPVFSTTPIDFIWDYGIFTDEDDRNPNPTITYNLPGTYTITLTALFPNKIVQAVQAITVFDLPAFTLSADRNYICQPGDIKFTALPAQPVATYNWNFGDGTPAVNQPLNSITHTFNAFNDYNVTVKATTTEGCSTEKNLPVSVKKPTASLVNTPKNGCLPANVSLQGNVTVPAGSTVSTYNWNFGDGSPPVSNTSNMVNHTYNSESGGKPTLSITTSEGCTNTFSFDSLFFGNPPQPVILSADRSSICFSETAVLRATSVGANLYGWDFGDAVTLFTTDTLVYHKFPDINTYNVKVTPYFNGCPNAAASLNMNVLGIKATFGLYNRCTAKSTFDFYPNTSGNVTSYLWDFGDGSPISNIAFPTHTFPGIGTYTNTLIVNDSISNCSDTALRYAYIALPKLIPTDSFACKNSLVTLKVEDANYSPNVSFYNTLLGKNFWNYGPTYNFLTLPADSAGIYNNSVIVYTDLGNNCPDTLIQANPIRVGGPIPDFNRPAFLCVSDNMIVQNKTTTHFPQDPVVNWLWNFGNGINTDNKANPSPFTYAKSGRYRVSLTVTDNKGCIDSVRKLTVVNHLPYIFVTPDSGIFCPGTTVQLNALHQGKIRWTPNSLVSCDTCSSITVKPLVPTIYTATASDTIGCSSDFKVSLNVYTPYTFNPTLRDTGFCIGGSAQLNVGVSGLMYRWTPSTGLSNATIQNPVASPQSNTTYQVDVIDSTMCFPRSAQATILVHPLPTINPGPTVVVAYNAPFTLKPTYGPDIVSYNWNPISQLNCSGCASPSGIALASIKYTVTATTSKGCIASDTLQLRLECKEENLLTPNAFTPNGDNLNDYFYPIARGLDLINKFVIYNRYGQIIFERNNFKPNDKMAGWNGNYNGKAQPSGSYQYVIQAVCDLGNAINKTGTVVLIK